MEIKKAQKERRTIVFADESGLSERPHRTRTLGTESTDSGVAVSLLYKPRQGKLEVLCLDQKARDGLMNVAH